MNTPSSRELAVLDKCATELAKMPAAAFKRLISPKLLCVIQYMYGQTVGVWAVGLSRSYWDEQNDSHAVFENGVFRPIETVDLQVKSEVEFELRLVAKKDAWPEGYFQQTAGAFANESFDRPSQGTTPRRDDW